MNYSATEYAYGLLCHLANQDYGQATSGSDNLTTVQAQVQSATRGLDIPQNRAVAQSLETYRSRRVAALGTIKAGLDACLIDFAKTIGIPERDAAAIIPRLRQYQFDNSKAVKERNPTRATVDKQSTTGNGTPMRLYVDANGRDIESALVAEKLTFTCTADRTTQGNRGGSEVFSFEGVGEPDDFYDLTGSAAAGTVTVQSSNNSILPNASFGQGITTSASSLTTAPTSWEVASGTASSLAYVGGYRIDENETTAIALRLGADSNDVSIRMALRGVLQIDPDQPYAMPFRYRFREPGTLTARKGSASLEISATSTTDWTVAWVEQSGSALSKQCWPDNWNENDADIRFDWESGSTGSGCDIDDVGFRVLDPVVQPAPNSVGPGNPWYLSLVAGSTPFLLNDELTCTDSLDDNGIIQQMTYLLYGEHFNHSATATWAEPT